MNVVSIAQTDFLIK